MSEIKQTSMSEKAIELEINDVAQLAAWENEIARRKKAIALDSIEKLRDASIASLQDRLSRRLGKQVVITEIHGTEIFYTPVAASKRKRSSRKAS